MKLIRLPEYDYAGAGCYFLTVCTKDKAPILSQIAERQLLQMAAFYDGVRLEKYDHAEPCASSAAL